MTDDVTKLPYYPEAAQRHTPRELFEGIMYYYYTYDAPLGEDGVGVWLYFGQKTMRN